MEEEDEGSSFIITLFAYFNLSFFANKLDSTLSAFSYIKTLSLWSNQLGGTLPREIGNLYELERLWVDTNAFIGRLPRRLSFLDKLGELLAMFDYVSPCP